MVNKRRRYDEKSGMAAGVDYLLRQQGRLDTNPGLERLGVGVPTGDLTTNASVLTYLVASSVARQDFLAIADFRCSGVNDEVELNAAGVVLSSANNFNGGILQLTGGTFGLRDAFSIDDAANSISVIGAGVWSTTVSVGNVSPSPDEIGAVAVTAPYAVVSDMRVVCLRSGYKSAVHVAPASGFGAIERVHAYIDPNVTEADLLGTFSVTSDVVVRDVYVEAGAQGTGVYVNGDRVSILNSHVHSATAQGVTAGDGISITATSEHCIIMGNKIGIGGGGSSIAGAGIRVAGDNCIVIGNIVPDGIVIEATADGTIVGGNIGTITDNGTNTVFLDNYNVAATDFDTERWSAGVDVLVVKTGDYEIPMSGSYELIDVEARVKDQPTGSSIIVDLMKNGTTVFSTPGDRPTIATSTNEDTGIPNVTAGSDGDYLRVDIIQKDSNDVGQFLTVTVRFRRT